MKYTAYFTGMEGNNTDRSQIIVPTLRDNSDVDHSVRCSRCIILYTYNLRPKSIITYL